MVYFKASMLAFLLLAANVLAVKCTYSVTHTDVENGKPGYRNTKAAEVDQDKADSIIANMGTWSGGKYSAQKYAGRLPALAGSITVTGSTKSSGSNAMIQDMQHVVTNNYEARSRSPGPGAHRRVARMVEILYEA